MSTKPEAAIGGQWIAVTEREASADALDAARYRWLREQHWHNGPETLVVTTARSVKLGSDVPSGNRLDEAIDACRAPVGSSGRSDLGGDDSGSSERSAP